MWMVNEAKGQSNIIWTTSIHSKLESLGKEGIGSFGAKGLRLPSLESLRGRVPPARTNRSDHSNAGSIDLLSIAHRTPFGDAEIRGRLALSRRQDEVMNVLC